MSDEKKSSGSDFSDGTGIDLGEDLLEKTALIGNQPGEAGVPSFQTGDPENSKISGKLGHENIQDSLESVKILISEGFSEDAKKLLHKILIVDPGNVMARNSLAEIHEIELKQIFGEREVRRSFLDRKVNDFLSEVDSEALMARLDQDLKLGLSQTLPLFEDQAEVESFLSQLERNLSRSQASPQDWIDLGIGFLEMDLYDISTRLFQGACRRLDPYTKEAGQMVLSATCLLALSQIFSGKPFDAVSCLYPVVRDADLQKENKVEAFYLMGRAYEAVGRRDLAYYYYQQVIEIDAHYRDAHHRLKAV